MSRASTVTSQKILKAIVKEVRFIEVFASKLVACATVPTMMLLFEFFHMDTRL